MQISSLVVLFKSLLCFLIFCPFVPTITENELLKSSTINLEFSTSPFSSDSFFIRYFEDPLLGVYTFQVLSVSS